MTSETIVISKSPSGDLGVIETVLNKI